VEQGVVGVLGPLHRQVRVWGLGVQLQLRQWASMARRELRVVHWVLWLQEAVSPLDDCSIGPVRQQHNFRREKDLQPFRQEPLLRPFSAWAFAAAEERRLLSANRDLDKEGTGHTTSSGFSSSDNYRRTLVSSITPYSFILDSLDGCFFILLLQVLDPVRQLCLFMGNVRWTNVDC
jgi:hypothetical protein